MTLRVGFDAGLFPASDRGGLARYRRDLLRALLDEAGPYEFFVYGRHVTALAEPSSRFHAREVDGHRVGSLAGVYRQLWLPAAAQRDRIDVLHFPLGSGVLVPGPPSVVSVHDMLCHRSAELDYPVPVTGVRFRARKRYHRVLMPATLRRARLILASSESTRRDVVAMAGVSAARVRVVPLAVGDHFAEPPAKQVRDAALRSLGLVPGFVLAFSSVDPRKNTHRVVESYGRLSPSLRSRHPLVLVLTQDTHRDSLLAVADRAGVRGELRLLPYVSDDVMPSLQASAQMLAYPSLFEGFGLPVLEAMSLGVPVLSSPTGGLPEVAGDAAEWVDPCDCAAIAGGMERLLTDPELRRVRVRRGRVRARSFDGARTARATLEAYREVAR